MATVARMDVNTAHIIDKMRKNKFFNEIREGIPKKLPKKYIYNKKINHAPHRKDILTFEEKKLALKNALRYFTKENHKILLNEFYDELKNMVEYTCIGSNPTMKFQQEILIRTHIKANKLLQ